MDMNYLHRNIGIFYTTVEWRDKVFDKISSCIPVDAIREIKDNGWNKYIKMKDDTIYSFIKAEACCGVRLHEAYLQPDISFEIYRSIIAPSIFGCGEIYVVNCIEDFYFRALTADNYYKKVSNIEKKET